MRILLAAVLGGLVMFIWAALAHAVLPLGQMGMKPLPNEAAAVAGLKAAVADKPGLYAFPFAEGGAAPSGPGGLLIYSPQVTGITPPALASEAALEIGQALIVALVVSMLAVGGFGARIGVALLIGVAVSASTNVSYMIWDRFPFDYTLGYVFTDLVRYLLAGIAIALIVKPRPSVSAD